MKDYLGLPKNCIKIAFRTLLKNRLTTFVNLFGLTIGLTGCLLVGLFVLDEFSYDRHYKNTDRLYRITSTYTKNGNSYNSAQTYGNAASVIAGLPEFREVARITPEDEGFLFFGETALKVTILYADPAFIDVFGLDLLAGNPRLCLSNPSSALISESSAIRLFGAYWGRIPILGKTIEIDGRIPLTITGVFKDLPHHSHVRSDLISSLPSGHEEWMDAGSKVYTYALLNENADIDNLHGKLRNLANDLSSGSGGDYTRIQLQPVTDIYLFSSLEDENGIQGNIKNIYSLLLVALFLIVTTVTNFVNLNAASSFNRLKEVGVRQVLGAQHWQLRFQFLIETTVMSMLAMCLAVAALWVLLPFFSQLMGSQLLPGSLLSLNALMFTGGLTVGVSLLAGLYPAFFLSARRTVDALRGAKGRISSIASLRKGPVVFQFATSCIMIIMSIVAIRQVRLINTKSLGFDKENTIAIANPYMLESTEKIIGLRNELMNVKGVEHISITGYTPSQKRWGNLLVTFPEKNRNSSYAHPAHWLVVDEGFVRTMGLTLIAGRDFLDIHEHDKGSVIVNEKAVEKFGLNTPGHDPLGAELSFNNEEKGRDEHFRVVGVVRDFNFGSLHEQVEPLVMRLGYHRFEMALRLSSIYPPQRTIAQIGEIWAKTLPAVPFEYSYIKDRFDRLHNSDRAASKLFSMFCLLTILLSGLGLFCIVTYDSAARMKEIGIRKLLGASEWNIAFLVSKHFLKLVLVAYVLALPSGWMLTRNWISDFAYKTEVSWWIFALAGFALFLITVLTLGYQSIRISRVDPVDNLRRE